MKGITRTTLIGGGTLVAITLMGYMAGIQPVIASHAQAVLLRGRIAAAEAQIKRLDAEQQQATSQTSALRKELADSSINPDLSTARNQRFSQLAQLAQAIGVELQTVRPGEVSATEHGDSMSIEVTGLGPFADCVELVRRIRTVFPDFGISRLVFRREDDSTARVAFELTWFLGSNGQADPDD
ncbi:MAG: hypothetical protein AAGF47_00940 [Planctomycetota bacterium]